MTSESPPLLHNNIGGPPQASIRWRGLNRSAAGDAESRIVEARQAGGGDGAAGS